MHGDFLQNDALCVGDDQITPRGHRLDTLREIVQARPDLNAAAIDQVCRQRVGFARIRSVYHARANRFDRRRIQIELRHDSTQRFVQHCGPFTQRLAPDGQLLIRGGLVDVVHQQGALACRAPITIGDDQWATDCLNQVRDAAFTARIGSIV